MLTIKPACQGEPPAMSRRRSARPPQPPVARPDAGRQPVRGLRSRGTGRDSGAGTAELAIALPLLMLLLLAVVQFALWQHAGHVASSAARQATEAARVPGTADAGERRARVVLDQLAGSVLVAPQVEVRTGPDTVTVRVTGHAVSLIPGFSPRVEAQTSGVIEKFRPDGTTP